MGTHSPRARLFSAPRKHLFVDEDIHVSRPRLSVEAPAPVPVAADSADESGAFEVLYFDLGDRDDEERETEARVIPLHRRRPLPEEDVTELFEIEQKVARVYIGPRDLSADDDTSPLLAPPGPPAPRVIPPAPTLPPLPPLPIQTRFPNLPPAPTLPPLPPTPTPSPLRAPPMMANRPVIHLPDLPPPKALREPSAAWRWLGLLGLAAAGLAIGLWL